MSQRSRYATWLEIDLNAIENNIRWFFQRAKTPVMAVVKANGYGHEAVPVARAAVQAGTHWKDHWEKPIWLGVARLEEAVELRQAGLAEPILLLGYTPPDRYDEAIGLQISLTAWEGQQIQAMAASAARVGKPARVHLKVDTGMSRLGVAVDEAQAFASWLGRTSNVQFEGIFTHFACADETDPRTTDRQNRAFERVLAGLRSAGCLPPVVHAANSAASLNHPETYYQLIRPGIAIYGLQPSVSTPLPAEFRPALSWKAVLSHVKELPAGHGISYGHEYMTSRVERIGTVPVGYADGYRRMRGNRVLLHGKTVPVIGRICMDQLMVQLDEVPEAQPGDEIILIGSQKEAAIPAEAVAEIWGTINYEVVCAIGPRVPRLYV